MTRFFLSCEHGGNLIPKEYAYLFKDATADLNSHRGIDFGTLHLFKEVTSFFNYSNSNSYSRLLVELNRSLHHPKLFSGYTKNLPRATKDEILAQIYFPYQNGFIEVMEKAIAGNKEVVHISLHSFTPVLNGQVRNCDIGLLYHPSNKNEKELAKVLKESLAKKGYRVRYNYPYLGKADGFTTILRKHFPTHYAGLEIEINQQFASDNVFSRRISEDIKKTLKELTSGLF